MSSLFAGLAFTTPLALIGLLALPLIWWLLRFNPPHPQQVKFPPFRLLLDLLSKEEQPQHTPWWVLLIRLGLATAIILAVAGPLLNASSVRDRSAGPLLLVIDDGWASAADWQARARLTEDVLAEAERAGAPAAVTGTTGSATARELALGDAAAAARQAAALASTALTPQRGALGGELTAAFGGLDSLRVLWLSDGLAHAGDAGFADALAALANGNARVEVLKPDASAIPPALKLPELEQASLKLAAVRADATAAASEPVSVRALNGRSLADAVLQFEAGATEAEVSVELPLELRNEAARVELTGQRTAGGVYLFDDRWRRKSVAMVSGAALELDQPLLSPLYYVSRALQPSAEITEVASVEQIGKALDDGASMLVLADLGVLGDSNVEALSDWVSRGGILVRFAGPRLSGGHDGLVPVELRSGGRALGSALSWEQPQALTAFAEDSPFAGLAADPSVKVQRQVLAEPSATLPSRVWASLEDGTPLVTAAAEGKGLVVLFHVTANADWSNLPLTGLFVEMLKRLADMAPAAGSLNAGDEAAGAAANAQAAAAGEGAFTPLRILNGQGELTAPPVTAAPVETDSFFTMQPSPAHPAGIYARGGARHALNLDASGGGLSLLEALPASFAVAGYERARPTDLSGWLFAAALALFAADMAAMLYLTGGLARLTRRRAAAASLAVFITGGLALAMLTAAPAPLRAQDSASSQGLDAAEQFAMQASLETRIGYVLTGDAEVDATSKMGLSGLGRVLIARTSIEPAEPIAIDIERDVIVFFPIIYWPVLPGATPPDDALLAKLSDYMKNGGTIFFDTRDDNDPVSQATGQPSPATEALRGILDRLDVPALEPVPEGHVLTRAFYLMNTFPGRWAGGQLWVEARTAAADVNAIEAAASDGVSSIIIGSNDYAAAWAVDEAGNPQYPVSPGGEGQREYAWRTGVNVMMYALTGNYKADQVHVPALLERLGQ
ncbi:MAG: DUF4159 domain-containing protein [Anderseniella sp.]|jgi:hypothetical protein|nr:DUF4159 domain-containing protein [Anderseniella sp.]